MQDYSELQKLLKHAKQKYENAKKRLEASKDSPENFQLAAQEANDAWLEFKRTDVSVNQTLIRKTLGDLYGC